MSALLVWLASYNSGYILSHYASFLSWIGSRSYAIYLVHIPAYRLTSEYWQVYQARHEPLSHALLTLAMWITATVLIILLAEFNFRIIENPLRKLGVSITEKMLLQNSTKELRGLALS